MEAMSLRSSLAHEVEQCFPRVVPVDESDFDRLESLPPTQPIPLFRLCHQPGEADLIMVNSQS